MFIRLVEATVDAGAQTELEAAYRDSIIPTMEQADGCLFAGLLQSLDRSEQFLSLTIWKAEKHARQYVDAGTFKKNLDRVRPYLEDSTEWKIQLSRDDTLEYAPVSKDPVIKSYPVGQMAKPLPEHVPGTRSYLRVLSLKLRPGMETEFNDIYHRDIQPALENIPGCRYAFLIDNVDNDREMLSFTIWDDLDSVEHYEQDGAFENLLGKVEHTLGELYQWKMALDSQSRSRSVTSEDIGVSKFTLVAGKRFTQHGP